MAQKKEEKKKKSKGKLELPKGGISKLKDEINTHYGKNAIYNSADFEPPKGSKDRVSCGNLELDIALGGGVRRGRIVLVSGPYSAGKTHFVLKCLAQHTRKKQAVAYMDEEFTFEDEWAESCGIDRKLCWVGQGEYAERTLDLTETLICSGEFGAIVIDSLAALLPQKTKEEAHEDAQMGIEAKLMSKFLRKAKAAQNELYRQGKIPPTIYLINQIRHKIGMVFGNPETLPTGNAQHFYNSTHIDFRKKEQIVDKDDNPVGQYVDYNIKKNKTAAPAKKGQISMFVSNFKGMKPGDWDNTGAIIDRAAACGAIIKSGKFYIDKVTYTLEGLQEAIKMVKVGTDEYKDMEKDIKVMVQESPIILSKKFMYKNLWETLRDNPKMENKLLGMVKDSYPNLNISTPERELSESI